MREGISGPESPERLKQVDRWKPKRTHLIGMGPDGQSLDWISVWRH